MASLAVIIALMAVADVKDLPVTTINGRLFHYYNVGSKESIYSVVHKLKVPKDSLLRYNPAAEEGLKKGMTLYYPFDDSALASSAPAPEPEPEPTPEPEPAPASVPEYTPAPAPAPEREPAPEPGTHLVKRGETIYSLARRYGVSEDDLMTWNPALKDGLKADSRIYITDPNPAPAPEPVVEKRDSVPAVAPVVEPVDGYVVKEKETFYSIARDHGISVAELEAANPRVTLLKAGMTLTIPLNNEESQEPNPSDNSNNSNYSNPSDNSDPSAPSSIDIALILPFMTEQSPVSKQAQRFTEFYKGFLIAVDSMRHSRKPINIIALDSHGSTDTVQTILRRPGLKEMDVIIAPDNAAQLGYIARWGLENNVKVFNTFVIKDDTYIGNPMLLQSNIPSETMIEKAAAGLVGSLNGSTPVIITRKGAEPDKADFIKEMNRHLADHGITPVTIEFDNRLTPSALSSLDATGNYVFIPVTGKQAEVNKILPGLIEWHRVAPIAGIRVWGYPEWIAFRGETLQNMHALNTTIYSRFAPDEELYRNNKFDATFKRWYGTEMENATPRQGLLGFDTGTYILRLELLDDPNPVRMKYAGIQNEYDFARVDGGGWVNNALLLLNYLPGGEIKKISK